MFRLRPSGRVECRGDVTKSSPKATPVEVVEVEVTIEVGRPFVDGINDDGTSPELSSPT
jgi:hypothetical protein